MKLPQTRWIVLALVLVLVGTLLGRWSAPTPRDSATQTTATTTEIWTCSMHPQIQLSEAGPCPICGMDLIPVETDGAADAGASVLEMSASAASLARIRTVAVKRGFAEAEVHLVGRIELDETRTRTITAWVEGRLERLFIDFSGMKVRRGDHMVEIYSPGLVTAQEELLQALRTAENLRGREGGRLGDVAGGTVEAAREKLRLLGLTAQQIRALEERGTVEQNVTILAPMNGTVIAKHAVEGRYVQTGTPIYEMADLARLWVQLDAYESDLPWIRYGQEVVFTTAAMPGERFRGAVAFVDPMVDPVTRTAKIRLAVDNGEARLKPGMFVRATVRARVAADGRAITADLAGQWMCPMHPDVVSEKRGACTACGMALVRVEELGFEAVDEENAEPPLLLPASAPLITGRRAIVYVQRPGTDRPTFEGREVVLGPRLGDHYLVKEGLREGELVVVEGAFKIDSDLQIRGRPSMMLPSPTDGHDHAAPSLEKEMIEEEKAPAAFQRQLSEVVVAYDALAVALARDDASAALEAARGVMTELGEVDMSVLDPAAHQTWMGYLSALRPAAEAAAGSEEIELLRHHFRDLTAPLVRAVRSFGLTDGTRARLMFCPMAFDNAGAEWLQMGEQLANPYFGARMLRCGAEVAVYGSESE